MSSKDFIEIVLEALHNEFPSYTFKYQFDNLDDSHVIEYSPFDLIDGDIDFEDRKYSIIGDYFNHEFAESLVFINEYDPVGISNPELVLEGHFSYSLKNDNLQVVLPSFLNGSEDFIGEINFALAA